MIVNNNYKVIAYKEDKPNKTHMNIKVCQMVRKLKAPAIYKSEHEPFLPGNIAIRGVIGMISRKAISPLAELTVKYCKSGIFIFFSSLKAYPWLYLLPPDLCFPAGNAFRTGWRWKFSCDVVNVTVDDRKIPFG